MINSKTGEYTTQFEVGTPIQRALLGLVLTALLVLVGWHLMTAPKTFTVDSKNWECTATEPTGIEARCTNLRMKSHSMTLQ